MPRSRVCTACGFDLARTAPVREPVYGLLVCRCDGCAAVLPAIRAARATRRALGAWTAAIISVLTTLVVAGICIGASLGHDGSLRDHGLDARSLLFGSNGPSLRDRVVAYVSDAPSNPQTIVMTGVRFAATLVVVVWALALQSAVGYARSLANLAILMAAIALTFTAVDALDSTSHTHPWWTFLTDMTAELAAIALTLLMALPGRILVGWSERQRRAHRVRWLAKRLRKARARRHT